MLLYSACLSGTSGMQRLCVSYPHTHLHRTTHQTPSHTHCVWSHTAPPRATYGTPPPHSLCGVWSYVAGSGTRPALCRLWQPHCPRSAPPAPITPPPIPHTLSTPTPTVTVHAQIPPPPAPPVLTRMGPRVRSVSVLGMHFLVWRTGQVTASDLTLSVPWAWEELRLSELHGLTLLGLLGMPKPSGVTGPRNIQVAFLVLDKLLTQVYVYVCVCVCCVCQNLALLHAHMHIAQPVNETVYGT